MKLSFKWNIRHTAGLVIGALSPLLISPLTVWIISKLQKFPFALMWSRYLTDAPVQSKIISLSIISNLIWFYFFLNRERWDLARGVIIGSALYLPFIIYVNLIR